MDVLPLEDGGVRFLEMPGAFFEHLSKLPQTCDPEGDDAIEQRLHPPPMDAAEPETEREEAQADWADYVRPELEAAFDGALKAVMQDLGRASESSADEGYLVDASFSAELEDSKESGPTEAPFGLDDDLEYALEIPGEHVPHWFQVLNRARIVLAMKHRLPFSDNPLEPDEKMTLSRLLAAHLSEHYAEILEILVHQMEREIP